MNHTGRPAKFIDIGVVTRFGVGDESVLMRPRYMLATIAALNSALELEQCGPEIHPDVPGVAVKLVGYSSQAAAPAAFYIAEPRWRHWMR